MAANTLTERTTLAIGLEAWAGLTPNQTLEGIAARYNVGVDTVERNKEETANLHRQLTALFGNEHYFETMGFERHIAIALTM